MSGSSDRDAGGEATPEAVETESKGDDGSKTPESTPQSAALRRQQRSVGVAGAVLAGVALGVGVFQRFPGTPLLAVGAGIAGAGTVLWLVGKSIFPGEPTGPE